ncbi:alpha/beta fold hydrolase [Kordiimonas aquimaris]|uniref:alpha/beta fold hydrolase n=1 Tax=Kordiimonas aquimaris TaxID=707591 RepID=UPI0021CE53B1|nr:alpha/beta hydrolase [Kordiimonas aquimaris]
MTKTTKATAWHSTTSGDDSPSYVWLHGWGQDSRAFDRLQPLLNGSGKHQRFDQPGFGKTPPMENNPGTAEYADTLADILKGSGPHIFIGHSFGVRVSIQMAARHPELVQGIIGIAGAGLKRKRSTAFKLRAFYLRTLGKLAHLSDQILGTKMRTRFQEKFGSADYKNAGILRGTFVKVVNEDLTSQAQTLKCPTCLIYGSNDTETPPEFGQRYAEMIQNAEFHELPGFDHWDIMTRGAYQCEAVMKRFLEKVATP